MEFTKEEKNFLIETINEFVRDAKEVEKRDSLLTQNLTRFIYDENKVEFLESIKKKLKNLPSKE